MRDDEATDWALNDQAATTLIGTMLVMQVTILAFLLCL